MTAKLVHQDKAAIHALNQKLEAAVPLLEAPVKEFYKLKIKGATIEESDLGELVTKSSELVRRKLMTNVNKKELEKLNGGEIDWENYSKNMLKLPDLTDLKLSSAKALPAFNAGLKYFKLAGTSIEINSDAVQHTIETEHSRYLTTATEIEKYEALVKVMQAIENANEVFEKHERLVLAKPNFLQHLNYWYTKEPGSTKFMIRINKLGQLRKGDATQLFKKEVGEISIKQVKPKEVEEPVKPKVGEPIDTTSFNLKQLKAYAKKLNVKEYSGMTEAELRDAISNANKVA